MDLEGERHKQQAWLMSSMFDGTPEEVEGITHCEMSIDDGSRNKKRSRGWRVRVPAVCLSILLLAGTLVAHYLIAASYRNEQDHQHVLQNLTTSRNALRGERDVLRDEQNQMKTYSVNLTNQRDALIEEKEALKDERDYLKDLSHNLTRDRDALRDERDSLQALSESLTKERNTLRDERNVLRNERNTMRDERDGMKNERNTFRDETNALRTERDQLKTESSNLRARMESLQSQYNSLASSRSSLQGEVDRLKQKDSVCCQGWKSFNNKHYLFSSADEGRTWEASKRYCRERGGDLAMPKTQAELNFVHRSNVVTWIGLSDHLSEGRWRWVDGTELYDRSFWRKGEPNDDRGLEDCAEVAGSDVKLNDNVCSSKHAWVCQA